MENELEYLIDLKKKYEEQEKGSSDLEQFVSEARALYARGLKTITKFCEMVKDEKASETFQEQMNQLYEKSEEVWTALGLCCLRHLTKDEFYEFCGEATSSFFSDTTNPEDPYWEEYQRNYGKSDVGRKFHMIGNVAFNVDKS